MTGLGGNINHHNPVEVKCQVGIIETNTNPKFKLFRAGGWDMNIHIKTLSVVVNVPINSYLNVHIIELNNMFSALAATKSL